MSDSSSARATERTRILPADPAALFRSRSSEIENAIRAALHGERYILGPCVGKFEAEFASWLGVASAVGLANGTDALELCLRSLPLQSSSVIAIPSHTAVATATAVVRAGHAPLFVDIDPRSFTLDPEALAHACEREPRIAATIPVHLYGQPCDIARIQVVARKHGLLVVEDCSQAHGAMIDGHKVGTFGIAAAFSCYPTKNLGAIGDAGIAASHDPGLADRIRLLRQYGWRERYVSDEVGMNSRLDEIQAAILSVQLRHLDADNARRRFIAERYAADLQDLPLTLPAIPSERTGHAFHQYTVLGSQRDALQRHLAERDILTSILYPRPIHLMAAYADGAARCPVAERVCRELLCLPMHPCLSDEDVGRVVEGVRSFFGRALV
jgi:dTDP-4-amino-4,6-dideoxygalactose transaminase